MAKVTKPQIQDLYKFTRQHFVEHYDVQTELVDHLANDIEQIWLEYPDLSYEEAKQKSFKKFGVFGFMDVVEQRQKTMSKRYMKIFWRYAKEWFSIPKIVITITLFLVLFVAFSLRYSNVVLVCVYGSVALWSTYKSILLNRQFKSKKELSNKRWLLEELIFKQAGASGLILISQIPTWYNLVDGLNSNIYFVVGLALLSAIFIIWMYISLELLPNKAEKLLEETYPEYKIV